MPLTKDDIDIEEIYASDNISQIVGFKRNIDPSKVADELEPIIKNLKESLFHIDNRKNASIKIEIKKLEGLQQTLRGEKVKE